MNSTYIGNIEHSLKDFLPSDYWYIDEVRFCRVSGLYYVAMKSEEKNRGIIEFCVDLDFLATNFPVAQVINCLFHVSEFPILIYKEGETNDLFTSHRNIT